MTQGAFVWHDLATTDPEAAGRFYHRIVGWEVEEVPEMHYTLLKMGGARAAGIMAQPPHLREAGVPPHWTGYIQVADVDAMAEKVQAHGGRLNYGPDDIPGVGRFAAMADPDGAPFYLFQPNGQGEAEPGMMTPGYVGWNELAAHDHARAFDFYSLLFGWQKGGAVEMGPMGTYQMFGYGGHDRGGMMNVQHGMTPHWMFYFVVQGIEAARARVEQEGGAILNGPMEVPGGAWIINGRDPQGGHFALVSATK